ncbi:MAG: hypothetical protein J0I00_14265 [Burkholderiales bacterium]|nr:hypothetical protein [Burkholderiales bacterium]HMN55731.1 hypothetical protein [Ottowia sp.]
MTVNHEPEFLVISGVGLLGQRYKCKGTKSLSSYLSGNFPESSRPLRIIVTHAQESKEFICEINNGKMIIHIDHLGNSITSERKPIEEAVALMIPNLTKEEKQKFGTLRIIMVFAISWVILFILVDRFASQPSEATQARRDCLVNAALLALKNNDAEHFSDYSRRCY